VPEATNDQLIASMTAESTQRLAAFGGLLRGVGPDVVAEFNKFSKTLEALPAFGRDAVAKAAALDRDDSLPADHRRRLKTEMLGGVDVVLRKTPAALHQAIPRMRAMLEDGMLPKPAKDPTVRLLVRQELQAAMAAHPGTPLDKVRAVLGQNAAMDSELLDSYGKALVGADFPVVRASAIAKWMSRSDGTEKQLNSRKALVGLEAANLEGSVTAYLQAARAYLTRDEPLPPRRMPDEPRTR
jgi:hypothetical protein